MLKPCPFCGSKEIRVLCNPGRYGHFVTVKCEVCGAQSGFKKVERCAINCTEGEFCEEAKQAMRIAETRWNQRANTEEQGKEQNND